MPTSEGAGEWVVSKPGTVKMVKQSLCESCVFRREIVTRRSRFLLCQLSQTDPEFLKYPPQPVVRCDGYRKKEANQR
jgi:hypothetical protein